MGFAGEDVKRRRGEKKKNHQGGKQLEKDSPCNGGHWLYDPGVRWQPGGIFQRQQAGREGAVTLLGAYHSSASALPAVRSE